MSETALTVRAPQALDPYDPRDFAEARALAKEYADSKLFTAKHQTQTLAIMAAGRELGFSPIASLRMFYVADFGNGPQITLSADAMVAACLWRRDLCEYFRTIEVNDTIAIVETKRVGDPTPTRRQFTAEDAKRAKLGEVKDGKDKTATNWAKYPAIMLRHRAASILAREVYPDILGGVYTEDEAREAARDVTPAAPQVQPLPPGPAKAAPPEAEIVAKPAAPPAESDDDKAARLVKKLEAVTTEAERAGIVAEANALKLPKGPARDSVNAALKAAKERLAAPAPAPVVPTPSAATDAIVAGAEVLVREEIGSDG